MNEVRLSGILCEVEERSSGNGVTVATASLRFNASGDCVLLVAVDARTRQLTAFDTGAHIRVIGRVAVHKDGFVILVNECGRWLATKRPAKFDDDSKANRSMRELRSDLPME
jgi:hypothetical protein